MKVADVAKAMPIFSRSINSFETEDRTKVSLMWPFDNDNKRTKKLAWSSRSKMCAYGAYASNATENSSNQFICLCKARALLRYFVEIIAYTNNVLVLAGKCSLPVYTIHNRICWPHLTMHRTWFVRIMNLSASNQRVGRLFIIGYNCIRICVTPKQKIRKEK